MGLIHIDLFTTLDGVAQAPGGPDEDTEGGFAFGGWQAPLLDDVVGEQVGAGMEGLDALLLGRRTYDIFAAYWPHQDEGVDSDIARLFNRVPKYVASRGTPTLEWANSTLLGADLASAVAELRERHANVHVIGSLDLVQTLIAEGLFDRLVALDLPDPARDGQAGLRRRHRPVEPHPPRTGDHLSQGRRPRAVRTRRRHPVDR